MFKRYELFLTKVIRKKTNKKTPQQIDNVECMKTDRQSSHSQCLQRPLVAISASWLKFGQSTPQNTEWSCFNSKNSNIWNIYKKKSWQKKRPRTILKLENVMTGEKCYPTTSFSDMRLWWQKQWLNNMHWQDKLKITKTNKTRI